MLVFNGLLSDIAAGVLLGAAILCLTRGRYLGRADVAATGLALLVLATMRGVLGDLHGNSLTKHSIPFVNIVVVSGGSVLALAILFNASFGPEAARQIRQPSAWFISGIITIGAAACLTAFLLRGDGLDEFGLIVLASATASGWLIVTYRHLRTSQPVNRWLPIVLGLTTLSTAIRVPASLSPDTFWLVLPGAIAVLSAMVAIAGSMLDMRELVVDQREHLARRGYDQERLHDVRSVLAGLQLAATSLTSYEDRIDAPMRRRLHESVSAELIRLRELIEPSSAGRAGTTEPVSLLAAIRPVLDADALRGTTVAVDIDDVSIDARADEVATVVGALLDNAHLYAPGAPVELRARRRGTGVALEVRDFGPGIADDERRAIFDRGRRGRASRHERIPGTGLGLYLARHRARAMGGDLTAYAPEGGGAAFVLTIPVAATKLSGRAIEDIVATMGHDSRPALDWMPEMNWLVRPELREAAGA